MRFEIQSEYEKLEAMEKNGPSKELKRKKKKAKQQSAKQGTVDNRQEKKAEEIKLGQVICYAQLVGILQKVMDGWEHLIIGGQPLKKRGVLESNQHDFGMMMRCVRIFNVFEDPMRTSIAIPQEGTINEVQQTIEWILKGIPRDEGAIGEALERAGLLNAADEGISTLGMVRLRHISTDRMESASGAGTNVDHICARFGDWNDIKAEGWEKPFILVSMMIDKAIASNDPAGNLSRMMDAAEVHGFEGLVQLGKQDGFFLARP